MYFVIKCYYCKKTLTSKDFTACCDICKHSPCYFNGQENDMVVFENIEINNVQYQVEYFFENRDTDVTYLEKVDAGFRRVIFTQFYSSTPVTPDNVEDLVRRCIKMKAFL